MNLVESIKQPVTRSREFLEECWAEIKKVHFPTRRDTQQATIVVILGVMVVAAYLGAVDWALAWVITRILG
jgi:preprotein translocase subunit SecE